MSDVFYPSPGDDLLPLAFSFPPRRQQIKLLDEGRQIPWSGCAICGWPTVWRPPLIGEEKPKQTQKYCQGCEQEGRLREQAYDDVVRILGEDLAPGVESCLADYIRSLVETQPATLAKDLKPLVLVARHAQGLFSALSHAPYRARIRLEQELGERLGERHLRWLHRLAKAAQPQLKRGRPRKEAERRLVQKLAKLLLSQSGDWPVRKYDPHGAEAEEGPLHDLVGASLMGLPTGYRPSDTLHGIIREVCAER